MCVCVEISIQHNCNLVLAKDFDIDINGFQFVTKGVREPPFHCVHSNYNSDCLPKILGHKSVVKVTCNMVF